MGKYMRKAKVTGEVAVMEFPHQSTLGVRTRARTLALQRLQKPDPSAYLELRSRRLQKPFLASNPRPKDTPRPSPSPSPSPSPNSPPKPDPKATGSGKANPGSGGSASATATATGCCSNKEEEDATPEASFGENVLELEAGSRYSRETTPSSLMRDPETIRTPGSTTRNSKPTPASQRTRNSTHSHREMPSTHEMEEFFAGPEKLQQKIFEEKYNFDPANDKPLPGRYEWVKLDS